MTSKVIALRYRFDVRNDSPGKRIVWDQGDNHIAKQRNKITKPTAVEKTKIDRKRHTKRKDVLEIFGTNAILARNPSWGNGILRAFPTILFFSRVLTLICLVTANLPKLIEYHSEKNRNLKSRKIISADLLLAAAAGLYHNCEICSGST